MDDAAALTRPNRHWRRFEESPERVRVSDGDNSFRVRVLGRRMPGVLPLHDLLDAEVLIESGFVSGRLDLPAGVSRHHLVGGRRYSQMAGAAVRRRRRRCRVRPAAPLRRTSGPAAADPCAGTSPRWPTAASAWRWRAVTATRAWWRPSAGRPGTRQTGSHAHVVRPDIYGVLPWRWWFSFARTATLTSETHESHSGSVGQVGHHWASTFDAAAHREDRQGEQYRFGEATDHFGIGAPGGEVLAA